MTTVAADRATHDDAPDGVLTPEEPREHWQDETDAVFVYSALAARMSDEADRRALARIAEEEERHRDYFGDLLARTGAGAPPPRPSLRARSFVAFSRVLGHRLILGILRVGEGREVARFLREVQRVPDLGTRAPTLVAIARETAAHAQRLGRLAGVRGDPWHRAQAGGVVRNVVYGFNDGLTANFGLIAGVVGASVTRDVVLLSGVSGLVASAFSMAASGYLAATSQREVDANEVNVQRAELLLWPEREQAYLATLYQEKGLSESEAASAARRVMSDGEVALRELSREKLGITGEAESPVREGLVTGLATTVGAFVPLIPYLFGGGMAAAVTSFAIAMAAHFIVGAARSALTGRGWFRSGFDMFAVGLGVAAVGYVVGWWLTGVLPAG
ncbi:MAG TPA: VIT1/CCC1 transporter family protein [Gemmatimonadaceae bacterium]|nr:VIT1/CCC1 transporter family protein [Gemmatimonadaceae bacterium]